MVSLNRTDYEVWEHLLAPAPSPAVAETALHHNWERPVATISSLEERGLLVGISLRQSVGGELARLRPIPLGVGIGNLSGDATRFEIQNATLSLPTPIPLDPISIMFWWEFDGMTPLSKVAEHVASRLPEFSADAVAAAAVSLTCLLMARRLLYLDAPPVPRE